MIDSPKPTSSGASGPIPCSQAQRLITVMETESLPLPVAQALRKHQNGCEDCAGLYRVSMEGAARQRQFERRRKIRPLATPIWVPLLDRRRMLALRFLMVCGLAFAASQMFGGFREDPTLAVEKLAGRVWVGGEELLEEVERAWRSDLLETDGAGRARLTSGRQALELGPNSQLLVESALAQRVRLMGGTLEISGTIDVQTPGGVVRGIDANLRLELAEGRLSVACRGGRAEWITAAGMRELGPGDRADGPAARRVAASAPAAR